MSESANPTYCSHGWVLPTADHPAAGLEHCEHGCTDSLFVSDKELVVAEDEAREVFGF